MTSQVLAKIADNIASAPTSRRSVLELILQDPQRVLDESFEQLAQRAGSSVPTIMRTCRDLGYPGLREFKLALAMASAILARTCEVMGTLVAARGKPRGP